MESGLFFQHIDGLTYSNYKIDKDRYSRLISFYTDSRDVLDFIRGCGVPHRVSQSLPFHSNTGTWVEVMISSQNFCTVIKKFYDYGLFASQTKREKK